MPTSGYQRHLTNLVNPAPHDGLWLADEELALFLNQYFPKPYYLLCGDPQDWKYLRADVDLYHRRIYRFFEQRLLAFRVRFPNHERSVVEPAGGLVARLRCFLEEAAIKGETSIATLLDRLEAESDNRSPFDHDALEFVVCLIKVNAIRLAIAVQTVMVRPLVDRFAAWLSWLHITAGGGKTAAFVPLD